MIKTKIMTKEKKYKINDIFLSIQGEGFYTGKTCIFIRFSGCNLKCKFCDKKHQTYILMTEKEILDDIQYTKCKHIVFTGGEPSLQLNKEIIKTFRDKGYYLQIETNGTICTPYFLDWETISPKTKNINEIKIIGDEYKFIVDEDFDKKIVKKVEELIYTLGLQTRIYLQPENNRREMVNKTMEILFEEPTWRLSLQTQKLINIL